jgi:moderate conductance mechanosensitive channel
VLLQVPTTSPPTTAPPDLTTIVDTVTAPCRETSGFLCERVYEWTGNETLANWTAFLLDKPLRILLIVVLALIAGRIARRAIAGLTKTIVSASRSDTRAAGLLMSPQAAERATQRADTLGTVLRSVASVFIWGIALMLILGELGVNLAPLIAGVGIAGIALGFGAQSLVKDVLTGFFMLLEDQFGVGDVVDVGEAVGTVDRVTLRTTTVLDINGTLWHVPNGQILRVGNRSQLWSRSILDVAVAYGSDVDAACDVIKRTADELWHDPAYAADVKEEPEVLGVENFAADGITLRMTIKTEPTAQFPIERELRSRIKRALEEAGIEIPLPQRTVWLRTGDQPAPPAEPAEPAST